MVGKLRGSQRVALDQAADDSGAVSLGFGRDVDRISGVDAIVTMQAVHETRHKRRALPLLAQARAILRPAGQLLDCDHYFAGGQKPGLMLDRSEQPEVLAAAGYANVRLLRDEGGMVLYAAT